MSNLLIRVFSLVTYALRLRAFRLLISSSDGSVKRELAVKHNTEKIVNKFLVDNIKAATLYTAIIKTVCVFENLRKEISTETERNFKGFIYFSGPFLMKQVSHL